MAGRSAATAFQKFSRARGVLCMPLGAPCQRQLILDAAMMTVDDSLVSKAQLRDATLSGLRWVTLARIVCEFLALVAAVVLAHLVPPAAYGEFAIALVVRELAVSLASQGIGTPLVQRENLTRHHVEGAMAFGLVGGLALSLLTYFAVPIVSVPLFGEATTELMRLFAPAFAITGLMVVPLSTLQRHLEFNRISISEVIGVAVGALVSVVLALVGLNAQAYVLGSLAGLVAWAIVLLILARHVPLPRWRPAALKEIAATGVPAAGAGLAGTGTRNVDYAVLGAQLSTAQVGFYYRAFVLGVEHERKISGILLRIAFPVYSRAEDILHLRSIRRRMVRLNVSLIFPLLAFFIVVAPVLVPWMFGARWEPAVVLAQILAVSGMAGTLKNTVDPLVLAADRARSLFWFRTGEVFLYAAALILASSGGNLVVVCISVTVFRIVSLVAAYQFLLGPIVGGSFRELLDDVAPVLASCLALAAAALPIRLLLGGSPLVVLSLSTIAAFPAYAATLRLTGRESWSDIVLVAKRLIPRLGGSGSEDQGRGGVSSVGVPSAAQASAE